MSLPGAFHVDCVARPVGTSGRAVLLGRHVAASPFLAMAWLAWRARHVAEQLRSPACGPVLEWLADGAEQARAVRGLAAGRAYLLVVGDVGMRYSFTAAGAGGFTPGPGGTSASGSGGRGGR